jgi:hypothetical protein
MVSNCPQTATVTTVFPVPYLVELKSTCQEVYGRLVSGAYLIGTSSDPVNITAQVEDVLGSVQFPLKRYEKRKDCPVLTEIKHKQNPITAANRMIVKK